MKTAELLSQSVSKLDPFRSMVCASLPSCSISTHADAIGADTIGVDVVSVDTISVIRWQELSEGDSLQWERIRSSRPEFQTPFFSFAFARAVHATRGDVLVALLKHQGETVGYFPHHRVGTNIYPVGRRYNDAHGVIASAETEFTWSELLAAIGGKGFEFHSLVGPDRHRMSPVNIAGTVGSYLTSLGDDSRAALKRIEQEHRTMAKQAQKTRKLEREIGTLRLEVDSKSSEQLANAIELKRAHYRRTNILDLFHTPWTQELVKNLARNPANEAHVMLSLLWAGDRVVASHIGFREGELLHYWFPAYDIQYRKYSPGSALFIELVRRASEHGIKAIDMGFGEQPYKRKQTDTQTDVAFGYVSDSSLRRTMYRAGLAKQRLMKSLPMKETLKYVLRRLHPNAGLSDFS